MTILYAYLLYISIKSMEINSIDYEKINQINDIIYSKEYGAFLVVSLVAFFSLIFTGYLLI